MSLVAPGYTDDVRASDAKGHDDVPPRSARGVRLDGPEGDDWGRSESLDPDNVGDIADEGMGHRG